mgnify:CR=1 FL=1
MKKIILILLIANKLYPQDVIFNKANRLYTDEKYIESQILYDSLINEGYESAELYYNLGNCHYKLNNWANAIWAYEKSLKINNHNNTEQNLKLAQLKIVDRIEGIPDLFYKKWIKDFVLLLNVKSWQIICLISIWILFLIKITSLFLSFNNKSILRFNLLITIFIFSIVLLSYKYQTNKKEAIIFSSAIVVYSAPTENSTNLFSLHAGTKVELIDQIGEWFNIKLINGNNGWIKKHHCKNL